MNPPTALLIEAAPPDLGGVAGASLVTSREPLSGAALADELHTRFEPLATPALAGTADRPTPGNS